MRLFLLTFFFLLQTDVFKIRMKRLTIKRLKDYEIFLVVKYVIAYLKINERNVLISGLKTYLLLKKSFKIFGCGGK